MATPQKPPASRPDQARIIHNVSLGAIVVCPLIILIPPRKLDIYTISLLAGTFFGGNQLLHEYTDRSIVARWGGFLARMSPGTLPPKALEMQERIRKQRERERDALYEQKLNAGRDGSAEEKAGVLKEIERMRDDEGKDQARKLLEKAWYGGEGKDWKQKRDEREKQALDEGRGYGGLIMDQIWEVWNWGKEKNEEVLKEDKKVLEERRKSEEKK